MRQISLFDEAVEADAGWSISVSRYLRLFDELGVHPSSPVLLTRGERTPRFDERERREWKLMASNYQTRAAIPSANDPVTSPKTVTGFSPYLGRRRPQRGQRLRKQFLRRRKQPRNMGRKDGVPALLRRVCCRSW